jgi:hypothetical protein
MSTKNEDTKEAVLVGAVRLLLAHSAHIGGALEDMNERFAKAFPDESALTPEAKADLERRRAEWDSTHNPDGSPKD